MLALLYAYLCVPHRLRFVFRWLALCLFIVFLSLTLIFFYRAILTLPKHHGRILHSKPHPPLAPDFMGYYPGREDCSKEVL